MSFLASECVCMRVCMLVTWSKRTRDIFFCKRDLKNMLVFSGHCYELLLLFLGLEQNFPKQVLLHVRFCSPLLSVYTVPHFSS